MRPLRRLHMALEGAGAGTAHGGELSLESWEPADRPDYKVWHYDASPENMGAPMVETTVAGTVEGGLVFCFLSPTHDTGTLGDIQTPLTRHRWVRHRLRQSLTATHPHAGAAADTVGPKPP